MAAHSSGGSGRMNRINRKALPRHKPGTPWEPEEWEAFKAWAIQDGAEVSVSRSADRVEFVVWRRRGTEHRRGGPAYVYMNGYESWFTDGMRHRSDGPAIVCPVHNGVVEEFYMTGIRYTDGTFSEEYQE